MNLFEFAGPAYESPTVRNGSRFFFVWAVNVSNYHGSLVSIAFIFFTPKHNTLFSACICEQYNSKEYIYYYVNSDDDVNDDNEEPSDVFYGVTKIMSTETSIVIAVL